MRATDSNMLRVRLEVVLEGVRQLGFPTEVGESVVDFHQKEGVPRGPVPVAQRIVNSMRRRGRRILNIRLGYYR